VGRTQLRTGSRAEQTKALVVSASNYLIMIFDS